MIDRMARLGPGLRGGQIGPIHAAGPMDLGDGGLAGERRVRAGIDRYLRLAAQLEELQGILGDPCQGHIAGDGGERLQLQLRRGAGQQDRQGIIDAGVGIDDQHPAHARFRAFWRRGLRR